MNHIIVLLLFFGLAKKNYFYHPHIHHKTVGVVDSFDRLAKCESSNNPRANTGNGFYGAFQFDLTTWHSLGMIGIPSNFSYKVQRRTAEKLYNQRGWEPWPRCSTKLGLG